MEQINFEQKAELIDALLACSSMSERSIRDIIVNDLPENIKSNIKRNDVDRVDVSNIVSSCLKNLYNFEEFKQELRGCAFFGFTEGI